MRKLLKSIACFATAALVGTSALANYGWYATSIDIGGIRSDYSTWSPGGQTPDTDLGTLSSMTVSGVQMKVWDESNDRGGANMYFRLYDDNGQVGGDVDLWLGDATRIGGTDHDFSISYTGTFDLAGAFGVTLVEGKTYYLNMWAKTYKNGGSEYDNHWYNGNGDNFHTKFVYAEPQTYTLVASADDLVVGADYLVVSTVDGAASALKNEANGTAIGCLGLADAAISGNTISAASDAIVWQLKAGNHRGQRVWYNAAEEVYAAAPASAGDNAQLLADGTDDLAQWTIDTTDMSAVGIDSVSYLGRSLQRDGSAGNAWFAAYDSAQAAPRLYRADSTRLQTVTFDPNGGTYYDDMLTMKYVKGRKYWGVWKPASWEGHKFLGWYDENGERVRNDMTITEDDTRTFQARWEEIQTVTFNAQGGTVRGKESLVFNRDGVYAGFAMPVRDGYTFMGWFDENGTRVKNGEDVSDDVERTLYAHWGQTVRFDAQGGTVRGKASLTFDTAGVYVGFAKPTREGNYKFLGWFDEDDQRVKNGEDVTEDGERWLYAHWMELPSTAAIAGASISSRAKAGARGTTTYTDTITADLLTATTTSYMDFTGLDKDSSGINSDAVYAGNTSKSSGNIQLNSSTPKGIVTTTSGGKAKKVKVVWGNTTVRTLQIYGKASAYTDGSDLYGSDAGTLIGGITNGSGTELTITGDYAYIGMRSADKALQLTSVAIDWAVDTPEPTEPTVTLEATATNVVVGTAVTITATATNFSGDVTWSWKVNGDPASGSASSFTLTPATAGDYAVQATATSGAQTTNATVTITATAPVVMYGIAIADGIVNGSVETDPADEAAAGDTVTVIATADSGYALDSITVNGGALAAGVTNFTMPATNVTVSATFVEYVAPDLYFQFESSDLPTSYDSTTANIVNTGSTSADVPTVSFALQRTNRGNGNTDKKVGTAAMRLAPTGTDALAYNTSAFSSSLSKVAFQYAIFGTDSCDSFKVQVSSDGSNWQDLADLTASATGSLQTYTSTSVPAGSTYIRFIATNDGTSNNRRMNVDEIQLWLAPPVTTPTVTLSPSEAEVLVGGTLTLIATAENFSGPVTWEWTADSGVADGATFAVDTTRAGEFLIIAEATCGEEYDYAEATITVKDPPTAHDIMVDYGDGSEGTASASPVSAFEGDTVTLTVTPAAGYAVDTITASEYTSLDPIAVDPDTLTFVMPDDDVYVEVTFKEAVTYTLVESADDIVVGADYIIVATGNDFTNALKNAANGSRIGIEAVTIDSKTISTDSSAIVWQLKAGNHRGYRVWYNAAADVYAAGPSSAGNNAQLLNGNEGTNDLAQWTLDLSDLPTVKIASLAYDGRYLQKNSSDSWQYFATYTGGQIHPKLYRADSTRLQTVTFDPNGGSYYDDMLTMKYVKGRKYWGIWRPASWEGHKFLGWYDENGERVRNDMTITEDDTRTFQARWEEIQTVTFNAQGGTVRGKESLVFNRDGVYAGFAMPVRDGYTFMGWFDENGTRVKNGEDVSDDVERTLYAHWGQTVRFDAQGGTVRGKASLTFDTAGVYVGFAKPTREGNYKFLGWFDEDDQRVKNGEDVTEDAERWLYAHWTEAVLTIRGFGMKSAGIAARDARSASEKVVELSFAAVAGVVYEVEWTDALDGEWTLLKRWTADDDGETSVAVTVPSDSTGGFFRITAPMGE